MKINFSLNPTRKKTVVDKFYCHICGSSSYSYSSVLWNELVTEWQLSPEEEEYINLQQGITCVQCGSNMRSSILAKALLDCLETKEVCLTSFFDNNENRRPDLALLEINEAGGLSPFLKFFPNHKIIKYPEEDMHNLSKYKGRYQVVIHSDTLEHICNPLHALNQCKLALEENGSLIYTVPVIPTRLTRNRAGLRNSSHSRESREDYTVYTEFGADFWSYPIMAGFQTVKIYTLAYPIATAILATN